MPSKADSESESDRLARYHYKHWQRSFKFLKVYLRLIVAEARDTTS